MVQKYRQHASAWGQGSPLKIEKNSKFQKLSSVGRALGQSVLGVMARGGHMF